MTRGISKGERQEEGKNVKILKHVDGKKKKNKVPLRRKIPGIRTRDARWRRKKEHDLIIRAIGDRTIKQVALYFHKTPGVFERKIRNALRVLEERQRFTYETYVGYNGKSVPLGIFLETRVPAEGIRSMIPFCMGKVIGKFGPEFEKYGVELVEGKLPFLMEDFGTGLLYEGRENRVRLVSILAKSEEKLPLYRVNSVLHEWGEAEEACRAALGAFRKVFRAAGKPLERMTREEKAELVKKAFKEHINPQSAYSYPHIEDPLMDGKWTWDELSSHENVDKLREMMSAGKREYKPKERYMFEREENANKRLSELVSNEGLGDESVLAEFARNILKTPDEKNGGISGVSKAELETMRTVLESLAKLSYAQNAASGLVTLAYFASLNKIKRNERANWMKGNIEASGRGGREEEFTKIYSRMLYTEKQRKDKNFMKMKMPPVISDTFNRFEGNKTFTKIFYNIGRIWSY